MSAVVRSAEKAVILSAFVEEHDDIEVSKLAELADTAGRALNGLLRSCPICGGPSPSGRWCSPACYATDEPPHDDVEDAYALAGADEEGPF